jgi:hypothetical protein
VQKRNEEEWGRFERRIRPPPLGRAVPLPSLALPEAVVPEDPGRSVKSLLQCAMIQLSYFFMVHKKKSRLNQRFLRA